MATTVVPDAAPAYTATANTEEHEHVYQDDQPPPAYPTTLPDSFPIGRRSTTPLVTVEDLQAHLRVLGAFHALRLQVREAGASDPDGAWAVFLARAVHRFHKWVVSVRPQHGGGFAPMPPIDVLMVWHSYLLVRSVFRFFRYQVLNWLTESSHILRRWIKVIPESPRDTQLSFTSSGSISFSSDAPPRYPHASTEIRLGDTYGATIRLSYCHNV